MIECFSQPRSFTLLDAEAAGLYVLATVKDAHSAGKWETYCVWCGGPGVRITSPARSISTSATDRYHVLAEGKVGQCRGGAKSNAYVRPSGERR